MILIDKEERSTLRRISARLRAKGIEFDHGDSPAWSQIMYGAHLLGAEHPYMAVVYPEHLGLIVDNKPLPVENVPAPY